MREHENEPVPGLPERLPDGEHMLWQGAPRWQSLARSAFHLNKLAIYVGAFWLWFAVSTLMERPLTLATAGAILGGMGLGLTALALVAAYAWMVARTTMYTLTDQRLVIRFGIALPLTVNLPFALVADAGTRFNADGSGDVTVGLTKAAPKLSYLVIWPHARPWRLSRVEPMLRAVPDVARVSQALSRALAASAAQPARSAPVPQTSGLAGRAEAIA